MQPLCSWECTLKITRIELELLTDVYIEFDLKNGTRDKIWNVICYYAKQIINICMIIMKQKTTNIQFFSFTNYHGWALSQPQSYGRFDYVWI